MLIGIKQNILFQLSPSRKRFGVKKFSKDNYSTIYFIHTIINTNVLLNFLIPKSAQAVALLHNIM